MSLDAAEREGAPEPFALELAAMLSRLRVVPGAACRLDDYDPRPRLPDGLDKSAAQTLLAAGVAELARQQERLYAQASWAVLIVVQAMDAAGKDSTIKHVMSGVNPQGVAVAAFKPPGPEDLAHDFLWRISRALPARGMIGIFNRSHYEDVLVARVHPEVLARARLPTGLAQAPDFWHGRLDDIAAFERHLGREGTLILKFYLDVSRDEQKKRFLARLDEPEKAWKFDPSDIAERAHWHAYRAAYEAAIAATATEAAPWFVIPADRKWLMRLLVVRAVNAALATLALEPPGVTAEKRAAFDAARRQLAAEA